MHVPRRPRLYLRQHPRSFPGENQRAALAVAHRYLLLSSLHIVRQDDDKALQEECGVGDKGVEPTRPCTRPINSLSSTNLFLNNPTLQDKG